MMRSNGSGDLRVFLDGLKDAVLIEEVITRTGGGAFRRNGKYLRGVEHDSLSVDPVRGWWEWYSRGTRGDAIGWLQQHAGLDFWDAVRWLCDAAGVAFELDEAAAQRYEAQRVREDALTVVAQGLGEILSGSERGRGYARGRGFSDELIAAARLGYWSRAERRTLERLLAMHGVALDNPAVVAVLGLEGDVQAWADRHGIGRDALDQRWVEQARIPGMPDQMLIFSHWERGRCVFLSGRRLDWTKESPFGKGWNIPASLVSKQPYFNHCYGPHVDMVVVVEGQADAVTLAGWEIPAVALAGTGATDELVALLRRRHKRVIVALDSDGAGTAGVRKLVPALGAALSRIVGWPGGGDANDWMLAGGDAQKAQAVLAEAVPWAVWLARRGGDSEKRTREVVAALAEMGGYEREVWLPVAAQGLGIKAAVVARLLRVWLKEREGAGEGAKTGDAAAATGEATGTTAAAGTPAMPFPLTEEQERELLRATFDHEGNALCVKVLFGDKLLFVPEWGWVVWDENHWTLTGGQWLVEGMVVQTLQARAALAAFREIKALARCSTGSRSNTLSTRQQLERLCLADPADFDNDPDVLNCANGLVNLRTGEIVPHEPTHRVTYCIPTAYRPDADQTEWLMFVVTAIDKRDKTTMIYEQRDPAMLDWLQMAAGYSITGHTNEAALFYIYGPTRSGKGVFTQTIQRLLGSPLANAIDFHVLVAERSEDSQNFALAPLRQARFLVGSEPGKYERFNEAKMKSLTGRDAITCSYKFKSSFTYFPTHKIWLSANWPFNADTNDAATWGRVRIIEFPNSYLGEEDKGLADRLARPEALEGVLAWLVEGARRWYASDGLKTPAGVAAIGERQRHEQDFIQQFIDDCCVAVPEEFVSFSDIYEAYQAWCSGLLTAQKHRSFSLALSSKGFDSGRRYVDRPDAVMGGLFQNLAQEIPTRRVQVRGFEGIVLSATGQELLDSRRRARQRVGRGSMMRDDGGD